MAQWKVGTLLEAKQISENVKMLRFQVAGWEKHSSGQHYDIKLTAPDGYVAERSYSVSNPPDDVGVAEFGIQILENGEVSPYLWSIAPGAQVEMRGPIGGHFVWSPDMDGDLVVIGGGSGMVPLMSMLREESLHPQPSRSVRCLASVRALEQLIYKDEIIERATKDTRYRSIVTVTEKPPADWKGYTKRIDSEIIMDAVRGIDMQKARVYVCGPTRFVEAVANTLVSLGFNSDRIKTERFG